MPKAKEGETPVATKLYKGVCPMCGIAANVLTCLKKHGKRPNKLTFDVSTYATGICVICGEETMVTEERDFFYPDFSLIAKVAKMLKTQ